MANITEIKDTDRLIDSVETLNDNFDALSTGKSDIGHNHDDRYYTESETNALLNNKANASDLSNYLSLSGGTVTEPIISSGNSNDSVIKNSVSNNYIAFRGGIGFSKGASLILYGSDEPTYKGNFRLTAHNGSINVNLIGTADGTLMWGGKDVSCVDSSGTNYIRYTNGLQICHMHLGSNVTTDSNGEYAVTYPQAFVGSPSVSLNGGYGTDVLIGKNYTLTGLSVVFRDSSGNLLKNSAGRTLSCIAIGGWK